MKKVIGVILGFLMTVVAAAAWAAVIDLGDPLDPAVLHIGDPPNSGTYLYGTEVRPISSTHLGILENGNGQPILFDPALLLILGVPNMTSAGFTAPAITLSSGTGVVGGANLFSGTWNTITGYAGMFTSGSDVYKFIGLKPSGNASNNFTNWYNADLAVNGINAAGFGIFVYRLTGTGITGGATVGVDFASALPVGTFVVAYGHGTDHSVTKSFTTPFTEAGLTDHHIVPEPSTMLLLGSGLVGIAGWGRKKFRK